MGAEQQNDRECADQAAARARDEDLQRLAKQKEDQANLRVDLDHLVKARKQQRDDTKLLDFHLQLEADAFRRRKRAFAEKLASERQAADDSRGRVLSRMMAVLRTNQLQAQIAEQLRETVRRDELQVEQQRKEELQLRTDLERRLACVQACQESLQLLEERRQAFASEEQRE